MGEAEIADISAEAARRDRDRSAIRCRPCAATIRDGLRRSTSARSSALTPAGAGRGCGSLVSSNTMDAVLGRNSAAKASGSDFSGRCWPSRADDIELVMIARRGARHEDFPIADAAHAHRMPPRVPEIEIADHADPPRIGREHDERDAVDAVERHRMRAELVVKPLMSAFAEQIQIEVGQHRRKAVGVLEFDHVCRRSGRATDSALSRSAARRRTGRRRESAPASPFRRARRPLRPSRPPAGTRAPRSCALGMRAEIMERIGVAAFDDRIGLGGQFAHAASSVFCGQYSERAGQRDAQPVRPVGQFVFDLVKGFLQQKEIQQPFGGVPDLPAKAADVVMVSR